MFDEAKWGELINGRACPVCQPAFLEESRGAVVATLASGVLLLQNDADFRGYCILYHKRHVSELHQLTPAEQQQFIADISRTAAAIEAVCRPAKLNYAILGNLVPHLHCHVIPRTPTDGYWGKPIWLRPDERKRAMDEREMEALRMRLGGEMR